MFTDKLFEILKKQGVSFLLLGIAVWYFYLENNDLRSEVKSIQADVIKSYQNDNAEMRKVIERNTIVMEAILKNNK
jgi:hypothetical protein